MVRLRYKDQLSTRDVSAIEKKFFDPMKALEAVTSEAKRRKQQGEEIDLSELIQSKLIKRKTRQRKPRATKETRSEQAESRDI